MSKKQFICDWCDSFDNQEKVGEDYMGYIICCRNCSHEYVVIADTKDGRGFEKFMKECIEEMEKEDG